MAAPLGNQFWKLRAKDGRDKIFKEPEDLWKACTEYFEWCDENPWVKKDFIRGGDSAGEIVNLETARPYTLSGLCNYLGVSQSYWRNLRRQENLTDEYLTVITRVEGVIETQQFEGAAVGAFNANIISRKLGLIDKNELGYRDKDGNPIDPPEQVMIIGGKEIKF